MTDRNAEYREGIEAELLPCPFCGNKNIRVCSNGIGDFYAICTGEDDEPHCGASCSEINCETEAKAVRRWNTRALPLPSTPDDGKAEPVGYVSAETLKECAEGRGGHIVGAPSFDTVIPVYSSPASDGAIREALTDAFDAIKTLPVDALGFANDDASQWSIRDELLAKMGNALSAHAGDAAKESGGEPLCSRCQFWANLHPTKGMGECCIGGPSKLRPIKSPNDSCDRFSLSCPPDTHAEVKG